MLSFQIPAHSAVARYNPGLPELGTQLFRGAVQYELNLHIDQRMIDLCSWRKTLAFAGKTERLPPMAAFVNFGGGFSFLCLVSCPESNREGARHKRFK